MKPPITVISLGGSIIVPDDIDTEFLAQFAALIRRHLAAGMRFIIIAGGGKTARYYQDAARAVGNLAADDLDWLGIHATRLNGHLVRSVFKKEADPVLITSADDVLPDADLIVAAGWKPGHSTDYVAIQLAKKVGASHVINLSNIEYVYTADPRKNPDAQKIEKINWIDFRKLLPETWDPGLSSPFDPIAAQEAQALGLEVAVIKGTSLTDLDAYLSGLPFKGTLISD